MGSSPLGPLAFWEGQEELIVTLLAYAVGIALYGLLVGGLYLTLKHRNLLPDRPGALRIPRPLRFALLFPLVTFGLFLVLSVAMFFLVKEGQATMPQMLLLSMAVVASVRVAAYLSTTVAEDIGKTVPLGLLGVLLVSPGFLTLDTALARLRELPDHTGLLVAMLATVVLLEGTLRLGWVLSGGPARAARRDAKELTQVRLTTARERARQLAVEAASAGSGREAGHLGAVRPPIPRAGVPPPPPLPPALEDLDP